MQRHAHSMKREERRRKKLFCASDCSNARHSVVILVCRVQKKEYVRNSGRQEFSFCRFSVTMAAKRNGTETKQKRGKEQQQQQRKKKKLLFLSFHLIPLSLYCVYCKWQMVDVLLGSTHIENLYPIVHVYDSIICATRVPNSTAPPTTTKFYMNKIPVEKDRIEIVYFAHTYSH